MIKILRQAFFPHKCFNKNAETNDLKIAIKRNIIRNCFKQLCANKHFFIKNILKNKNHIIINFLRVCLKV